MNTEVHSQTQVCNYATSLYKWTISIYEWWFYSFKSNKFIYNRLSRIIVERFTKPWLVNDFLFNLTPTGREQKQALNVVHSFTDNVGPNKL